MSSSLDKLRANFNSQKKIHNLAISTMEMEYIISNGEYLFENYVDADKLVEITEKLQLYLTAMVDYITNNNQDIDDLLMISAMVDYISQKEEHKIHINDFLVDSYNFAPNHSYIGGSDWSIIDRYSKYIANTLLKGTYEYTAGSIMKPIKHSKLYLESELLIIKFFIDIRHKEDIKGRSEEEMKADEEDYKLVCRIINNINKTNIYDFENSEGISFEEFEKWIYGKNVGVNKRNLNYIDFKKLVKKYIDYIDTQIENKHKLFMLAYPQFIFDFIESISFVECINELNNKYGTNKFRKIYAEAPFILRFKECSPYPLSTIYYDILSKFDSDPKFIKLKSMKKYNPSPYIHYNLIFEAFRYYIHQYYHSISARFINRDIDINLIYDASSELYDILKQKIESEMYRYEHMNKANWVYKFHDYYYLSPFLIKELFSNKVLPYEIEQLEDRSESEIQKKTNDLESQLQKLLNPRPKDRVIKEKEIIEKKPVPLEKGIPPRVGLPRRSRGKKKR